MFSKSIAAAIIGTAFAAASVSVFAQMPASYPADYAKVIENGNCILFKKR